MMAAAAWWDHDSELLGEALSVFADWKDERDDDGCSSTTSASSDRTTTTTVSSSSSRPPRASPPPPVAVHGPRPVKINRSRERQKQETRQLQQQVIELEEELLRLNTKREKRPRPTAAQATSSLALIVDAPRPGSAAAILAWEKATRRQFRARKKAEMVNARLREMVRTHAGVAEDLARVIQRAEAARQQAYGTALFPVREPAFTLSAGASDQELQHQLMKISAQWHVPFAQSRKFHDRGEQVFFETTVLRDDGAESLLEIRASMVYPQQRHRMEDELWEYFRTLSCTEDEFSLAMSAKEDSDTLLGSLRATLAKDGVLGVLDARFMKQQFRNERGELIIASTTCGRPGRRRTRGPSAEDEELAQVDAVVSEDSWLRVLDAAGPGSSSSSLTCIQNVRRARIQFGGMDPPDRPKVEAVKKFLARLAENEMRWGSEVVERRLMLGPCNRMPLTA